MHRVCLLRWPLYKQWASVHPQPPLGNCTLHLSKGLQKISCHGWLLLRSLGKHMNITKREWSHFNPSQFLTWDFFFRPPDNTWAIGHALHHPDMGSRSKPRQLQSVQTFEGESTDWVGLPLKILEEETLFSRQDDNCSSSHSLPDKVIP